MRYEIRRAIVASLPIVMLLCTFGMVANAQMFKEGEGMGKTYSKEGFLANNYQ